MPFFLVVVLNELKERNKAHMVLRNNTVEFVDHQTDWRKMPILVLRKQLAGQSRWSGCGKCCFCELSVCLSFHLEAL